MATVTVLYPAKEGATFDMDYYKAKHMPLAAARWGPFGMKDFQISDLRHTEQPYSVQATLHWDSLEGFQKGVAEHGPEIMADVKAFSSEHPILLTGNVVQTMAQVK